MSNRTETGVVERIRVAWAVLAGRPYYVVTTPDLAAGRAFPTSEAAERWTKAGGMRFRNASQTVTCNGRWDRR